VDVKPRQGIVEVEVTRGGRWESVHAVAWALAAADDRPADGTVAGLPDVFPRSAVKPLQALPVIETGAADSFGVSAAELALAAASHSGEPDHVAGVRGILAKAGCTVADLACGTHAPFAAAAAADLVRRGLEPSAIEHNCSGQHAAFLLVARHLGAASGGYTAADHPVQRLVTEVLADLAGLPLGTDRFGIDGCGIPTFAIPLDRLAVAWARFAAPDSVAVVRREAARRVLAAMVAHPRLVAGSDRFDTLVMESIGPRAVVKAGAEGVSCAAVPGAGLGIAVKALDGAGRAAEIVMAALLGRHVPELPAAAAARLSERAAPVIRRGDGTPVGGLRLVAGSRLD
jgi:L-asparaginase II